MENAIKTLCQQPCGRWGRRGGGQVSRLMVLSPGCLWFHWPAGWPPVEIESIPETGVMDVGVGVGCAGVEEQGCKVLQPSLEATNTQGVLWILSPPPPPHSQHLTVGAAIATYNVLDGHRFAISVHQVASPTRSECTWEGGGHMGRTSQRQLSTG